MPSIGSFDAIDGLLFVCAIVCLIAGWKLLGSLDKKGD
jgi:hypothetical protein